ncbi:MAG: hypothetical protein QM611_00965 [Microbacterium sp.]|uniref:hypothetical protein n=1 Tax=Microbacterium sp. TaxID=51671 RepID=UPI0039E3D865
MPTSLSGGADRRPACGRRALGIVPEVAALRGIVPDLAALSSHNPRVRHARIRGKRLLN